VIQVTLSFPDQAALVQFFTSVSAPAPVTVEAPVVHKKADKVATSEKRVEKAAEIEQVKADPKPEPVATTSSEKPSASVVDYPTLQKAVFALAGKSRESAAAVAASMGVKTFKELPESKWADALVAVNAALAA